MSANRGSFARDFAVLATLACVVGYLAFGETIGGDKVRYLGRGADILARLAGAESYRNLDNFDWLFLVPNLVMALGYAIMGETFGRVSIAANAVLYVLCAWIVVKFACTWLVPVARPRIATTLLLLVVFFGLPAEVVSHVYVAYSSDVMFLSVSTLALVAVLRASLAPAARVWVVAIAACFAAMITRPSGVVPVAILAVAILASRFSDRRAPVIVLSLGAAGCAAAFLLWPWVIHTYSAADLPTGEGMRLVVERFRDGVVITGRRDTYLGPMRSYDDFLHLMVQRFVGYYIPFRSGYSVAHVVANIVALCVIVPATIRGACWLIRKPRGATVASLLVIAIGGYGVLHAALQVEDWRYYVSIWPPLWLLAASGVLAATVRGLGGSRDDG